MILGIGCDIIEIERVKKALTRHGFKERVFTPAEISYCESRGAQQAASFAARFAAKEAVLKALGTGLRRGSLTEIEVLGDALGKPQVNLRGYFAEFALLCGAQRWHITLSHSRAYAMAQAIMEGEK